MSRHYQFIVLGLGAVGSATLYQLASKGYKVLGIDQFSPPHTLGSTHGDTRITRQAIGEGTHYTPLSLRSYELFRDVERKTNQEGELLNTCGGLIISSDTATAIHVPKFFQNTVNAATKYGIAHDLLDAKDIRKRFPQFNVKDDERGYFEYEAGFLRPEKIVASHIGLAKDAGAEVRVNERVSGFSYDDHDGIVRVETENGKYEAGALSITAGPWVPQLVPELAPIFKVHRQVLYWFDLGREQVGNFQPGKMPIFIWEMQGGLDGIYGFPAVDGPAGGFKIASEEFVETTTPETARREVSEEEIRRMFAGKVQPFFPDALPNCLRTAVCLYTVTPDFGFVVDWLPQNPRVLLVSPCSGHGFKHSAAVGEAAAQMLTRGYAELIGDELKLRHTVGIE